MDLGIPQKSLRVRLKEEKEGKGHSFFHEHIERGGEKAKEKFLSGGRAAKDTQKIRTAGGHTSQD